MTTADRTRAIPASIRSFDTSKRTADFIASTDAIDAYDEIVDQGTWDLSRFRANPVVLYAHDSRELPIGRATRCEVVSAVHGKRLECTIEFVTADMNPKGDQVWRMVQAGFLKAVSVGFRPGTVRTEKRDGKEIVVLADNLLHEISVTPIGANPEALAKAFEHECADDFGEVVMRELHGVSGPAAFLQEDGGDFGDELETLDSDDVSEPMVLDDAGDFGDHLRRELDGAVIKRADDGDFGALLLDEDDVDGGDFADELGTDDNDDFAA